MLHQLSGTDASFLYMETPETPMHVGGLYLYELPPGYEGDFYENFKEQIRRRMHLFPILTRKLAQLPFDLDAPLWVKDDNVDLDYHIRRRTVSKPGRFEQLEELVAELHSTFLDRGRPLWEIYIIDGLADGRVAEYSRFHHAGFDGSAAMAFIQNLYDLSPTPRPIPPPPRSSDKKEELDVLSVMNLLYASPLRQYLRTMQTIPDFLKVWTQLSLPDPETLKLEPPELPPLAPRTPLNVSITRDRAYAARSVSLKDIKQIAKTHNVTVNDVVLALCSGALRRYLRDADALPAESLTAYVPMSVRAAGNMDMTIQTIGMICSLATNVANPVKRLVAIHESSQKAKEFTNAIKSTMLGVSSYWGVPLLVYAAMNLLGRYHLADAARPLANIVVSNTMGPPVPLYLAGAKLVATYPCSIPTHGSALNITVQSYGDNLDVGFIACRRTLPQIAQVADYLVEALTELSSARAADRRASATTGTPARATHAEKQRGAATPKTAHRKRATAPRSPHANAAPEAKIPPDNEKRKFPYVVTKNGDAPAAALNASPRAAPESAATAMPPLPGAGDGGGSTIRAQLGGKE